MKKNIIYLLCSLVVAETLVSVELSAAQRPTSRRMATAVSAVSAFQSRGTQQGGQPGQIGQQSAGPQLQPGGKMVEIGLIFKGIEPGIGDPNTGFAPVRANVEVKGLSVPLPVGQVLDKLLSMDPTGMVNKIMVLNGETIFLLKLIGLFNELKALGMPVQQPGMQPGQAQQGAQSAAIDPQTGQPLQQPTVGLDEKISLALSYLGPLLARLSKTQLIDSKGNPILKDGKPQYVEGFSVFIDKLPMPLRELFNLIKLPGLVSAFDAQWAEDCAGKPTSEIRWAVSDIRQAEGFDGRLLAMDSLFPILEDPASAKNMTRTDVDLVEYVFMHQLHDLGVVAKGTPAQDAAAEIEFRVAGLAPVLSDILGVLESIKFTDQKVQERATLVIKNLDEQLNKIATPQEMQDDAGPYTEWVAKKDIPKFPKPLIGGERGAQRVTLSVPQLLDILFNRIKFDTLGYKFVGVDQDAIYDDAHMSKEQAVFYALAIAMRALKEKTNPNFGLLGFVHTALAHMYLRAPQYFEPIMKIVRPIMEKVDQLKNNLAGLADKAMGQAGQLQQQYEQKVNAIPPLDGVEGGEEAAAPAA